MKIHKSKTICRVCRWMLSLRNYDTICDSWAICFQQQLQQSVASGGWRLIKFCQNADCGPLWKIERYISLCSQSEFRTLCLHCRVSSCFLPSTSTFEASLKQKFLWDVMFLHLFFLPHKSRCTFVFVWKLLTFIIRGTKMLADHFCHSSVLPDLYTSFISWCPLVFLHISSNTYHKSFLSWS